MATRPKGHSLSKRVAALEKRLNELGEMAALLAAHRAHVGTLLVGWSEIEQYTRKKRRTLSRYVRGMAFPAHRWARHVVSSPLAIDAWLLAKTAVRKNAKARNVVF
jgi:hypothetical protein